MELINGSSQPLIIPPGAKIGTMHVVDINAARARLGLDFPDDIRIKRSEIEDKPISTTIVTGRSVDGTVEHSTVSEE